MLKKEKKRAAEAMSRVSRDLSGASRPGSTQSDTAVHPHNTQHSNHKSGALQKDNIDHVDGPNRPRSNIGTGEREESISKQNGSEETRKRAICRYCYLFRPPSPPPFITCLHTMVRKIKLPIRACNKSKSLIY